MKLKHWAIPVAIIVLGALVGGFVRAFQCKPIRNNVYQIEIYPIYMLLKDGDRVVDTIRFTGKGQLDTLIEKDNL